MVKRERHIFIVSDSTGHTCELVVRAALSQFKTTEVYLHKFSNIRSVEEVIDLMEKAQRLRGVVAFTFVVPELRRTIMEEGIKRAVPTIDILGPVLSRLQDLLELSPMAIPGLFRYLRKEYYERIDAIDFAVKHDDGRNIRTTGEADIILVGVSRTSKTPISIYLAYRGFKTANIPVIYKRPLPEILRKIDKNKIVGLTVDPYRLKEIRAVRAERLHMSPDDPYIDLKSIQKEVNYALTIFKEKGWKILDVTSKSIEEAATIIMELLGKRNLN